MGLYSEGLISGGGVFLREKHFNLQSVKLIVFLVSQYKARISAFSCRGSCEICSWLIREVNDKVNNKDTIDVVLVSLLLTFNTFDYLLQSFYF